MTGSVTDPRWESLKTRLLTSTACRWRNSSYETKKKVRFLKIGPPRLPPNWLRLKGGGLGDVKSKKLRASTASLRRNSNSSPWNLLVPERDAMLRMAPELCPYSALKVELSSLNSCRLLRAGWKVSDPKYKSLRVIPLIMKLTVSSRFPAVFIAKEP